MKQLQLHSKRLSSVCLFIFLLFTSSSLRSETVSLKYEDLPRLVHEKSGAVQASNISIQASQAKTGYLKRSFSPNVNVSGGAEYFKTGFYSPRAEPYGGGEVSMNLYRGGKDQLEDHYRQSEVTLSESKKEKVLRDEISQVRTLYWDLVYQREKIRILSELKQLNVQSVKSAQTRVQRGLTTNTDLLSMNLFAKQIQEEIESAQHEIELLQLALNARLGWEDKTSIQTSSQIPHDETALSKELPVEAPPEVKMLKAQAQLNKIESKQLSRWWTPALDVYGKSYLYTLQDREYPELENRLDAGVGVRLSSNVFDGFQSKHDSKSQLRQAIANETLAAHKNKILKNDAQLAQEEMRHLHQLIHNGQNYIGQARVILKQTLEEYDLGLKNTQEVLAILDRLLSLKQSELQRRLEYQKTKVKLLAILGE